MDEQNHVCQEEKPAKGTLYKPCPFCKGRYMLLRDYEISDDVARLIEYGQRLRGEIK